MQSNYTIQLKSWQSSHPSKLTVYNRTNILLDAYWLDYEGREQKIAEIAPGVIWVAGLLSALLSLDRLFADDARDGALDLLRLSGLPLELVVLAKARAHWLVSGLPLAIMAPIPREPPVTTATFPFTSKGLFISIS